MDSAKIIASAISDNELAQAFSELVAERWDNWDLSVFLPYLVDTCAASVLPYLADQFDVEGVRGFAMAMDEEQQRDIIKKSIALHKYIGTPWAIREACRTVGFPVIVLEEGVSAIPGGPESPEDWARFRVLVEAHPNRHITAEEAKKMRLFVEFYKNERSHLVEMGFFQPLMDRLSVQHEELDVMFLSLSPNPVLLTANGAARSVEVNSNVDWTLERTVYEWPDGSGNKLPLEFTGHAGHGEIIVKSDYYIKENPKVRAYNSAYSEAYSLPGSDERIMDIPIFSLSGKCLGILTVTQNCGFHNAYSRAYSNAYNVFNHEAYINVSPKDIWLPADPVEDVQIIVESNSTWTIE